MTYSVSEYLKRLSAAGRSFGEGLPLVEIEREKWKDSQPTIAKSPNSFSLTPDAWNPDRLYSPKFDRYLTDRELESYEEQQRDYYRRAGEGLTSVKCKTEPSLLERWFP